MDESTAVIRREPSIEQAGLLLSAKLSEVCALLLKGQQSKNPQQVVNNCQRVLPALPKTCSHL